MFDHSKSILRLPEPLRKSLKSFAVKREVKQILRNGQLNTVCEEARCPNIGECFGNKTATFMIMGDICTRRCNFCSVKTGKPKKLDENEPRAIFEAVQKLDLDYVVITSVDRDELPDGGASHFANVITYLKKESPKLKIEVLTSDFKGNLASLDLLLSSPIDVFGHNTETVPRFYKKLRPQSNFLTTSNVLKYAASQKKCFVKTGLMVGVGESDKEVLETLDFIYGLGVDVVTIGQYLRPSLKHWPVDRYVSVDRFLSYQEYGLALGFKNIFSGPFVRSSYKAQEVFKNI